jgi:hypothetical protein
MATDPVPRGKFSSAFLLPSGRIMTIGNNPGDGSFDTRISIYSPPYSNPDIATRPVHAVRRQRQRRPVGRPVGPRQQRRRQPLRKEPGPIPTWSDGFLVSQPIDYLVAEAAFGARIFSIFGSPSD